MANCHVRSHMAVTPAVFANRPTLPRVCLSEAAAEKKVNSVWTQPTLCFGFLLMDALREVLVLQFAPIFSESSNSDFPLCGFA